MARKKKHRDDEEELEPEEAVEEPEPEEDEAPADEEPPAEPEEEEEEEVERPPRPRTPVFTIVLLVLNFLAVIPFVLLLFLSTAARYQWTYATFLNRVYAWGLPLDDEENAPSAAQQTRPRMRIDSDRLKEVFSKHHPRPAGSAGVPEPFQPVDTVDEPTGFWIRPSQIDARVQADLFTANGLGEPVKTLEDEVRRLKTVVPQQMDSAADMFVGAQKSDEAKKKAAERIFLPLAWSTGQVEAIQKRIDAAQGADLDALLKEAVLRRMHADVLAPLNVFRPGAPEEFTVEKISETDLDAIKAHLQQRFDQAISKQYIPAVHMGSAFEGKARGDVEKRQNVAFLLFDLARLKAPDAKEPLLARGFDRAQVVSGLFEFAQAAANYARALRVLDQVVLRAIDADRDGYVVADKGTTTGTGFVDEHLAEIIRLKKAKADIEFTQKRVKELQAQQQRYQKQYEERLALLTEVTKKLVDERRATAKQLAELQVLEQELFTAQVQLSNAAERNADLEKRIRELEKKLTGGK
jgi:hypothetical protein